MIILPLVVAFLIATPVLFPYLVMCDIIRDRRQKRVAKVTPCSECGQLLGEDSLKKSAAFWQEEYRRMRLKYPHNRIHLRRWHDALCTQCGAAYAWLDKRREFSKRTDASDSLKIT